MKHPILLVTGLLFASATWAVPEAQSPAALGDPAKAQEIVTKVCAACHGSDGNSTTPIYPVLAGQSPEYLYKQLVDFKSGARRNATMAPNVANLSDQDMRNLAAYYAMQSPKPRPAKDAELAAEGQRLYRGGNAGSGVPACMACHGPTGAGIPTQFPRLAGQHAKYTVIQLRNFRSGDRRNDGGKMMQVIARKMTDREKLAVAEYISGLR